MFLLSVPPQSNTHRDVYKGHHTFTGAASRTPPVGNRSAGRDVTKATTHVYQCAVRPAGDPQWLTEALCPTEARPLTLEVVRQHLGERHAFWQVHLLRVLPLAVLVLLILLLRLRETGRSAGTQSSLVHRVGC